MFVENKKKAVITPSKQGVQQKKKREEKKEDKNLWAAEPSGQPVWHDEGVEKIQVKIEDKSRLRKLKKEEAETQISGGDYAKRLQEFYEKQQNDEGDIFSWAKKPVKRVEQEEEEEDPIAALLKSNVKVFESSKGSKMLKPGSKLEYTKITHANAGFYHQSVVSAVEFHPKEEGLVVTAGLDRKAQLFQVSKERPSQKIQTLLLPNLPIYSARFILGGSQLLLSGNRKHFYYYDLGGNKLEKVSGIQGGVFANTSEAGESLGSNLSRLAIGPENSDMFAFAGGDSGAVAIMSQKTKKLIFELKLSSSTCTAVGFGTQGHQVYAVGDQAEIYVWDIRNSKRCIAKVADEGSFNTTHLTVSSDGTQLATGSHSGIVNIYRINDTSRQSESSQDALTMMKSVMNLTTAITDLRFDSTGQILAVCSKWKKNAVRLIHTGPGGSYSAYQNFPAGHAVGVLKYPMCLGFSSDSQYFSLGNDEGKAHMWHLSHFSQ